MTAATILLLDQAEAKVDLHSLTTTELIGLILMGCAGAFVLAMTSLMVIKRMHR